MIKLAYIPILILGLAASYSSAFAQNEPVQTVNAYEFLGPDWMRGPHHQVDPIAELDGNLLVYRIQTPHGLFTVRGTETARNRIREITATETLRKRGTATTIVEATAGRVANIVGTPVRVIEGLNAKAQDISSVEKGILFLPKEVANATSKLITGVGELAVTGKRITTSAASTQCNGFECVEKAGEDVWSGFNSLMGKHNSARRLHSEFGTDPQTDNKAYRKQIDRLAYAESYTATSVKLGVANAGISYLSPAMQNVGWYNNGEFVAGYEDAHRRRNFEKQTYLEWGAYPDLVESLYQNEAFTKLQRRRLFTALDAVNDVNMQLGLLNRTAYITNRNEARIYLAQIEDLSQMASDGRISSFIPHSGRIMFFDNTGAKTVLIYADYLDLTKQNQISLMQDHRDGVSALRVLGHVSPRLVSQANALGMRVENLPH